jgi:prephenate dehydrogenase
MGKWFARFLLKEGMEVVISGRNQEKLRKASKELDIPNASNTEAVKQADVVVISVPVDTFEAVVKEIAPHIKDNQVVVDVTSLKTLPVETMHRYVKKGTVLGTHPVFGPGARSLDKQNFVLTPTNDKEKELAQKVEEFLTERGAQVSIMSPEEHDEIMSVVLGLAHFIAIVSADTLLSFKNFAEMKKIGGTTFKLLYTLVESVISEDPQLYATLQVNFPDISKVEGQFLNNVALWGEMVKNRDSSGFAQRMSALREKLEKTDPAFRKAYENMYRITEGI